MRLVLLLSPVARVHSEETDKKGSRKAPHHQTAEPDFDPVCPLRCSLPNQDTGNTSLYRSECGIKWGGKSVGARGPRGP